jgi:hypothetical protein
MSALEEYKETYNKFVTMLIDLHNTNVLYTRQQSFRNAADLRRILRQLKVVEKALWSASLQASKEAAHIEKRGRPKKER